MPLDSVAIAGIEIDPCLVQVDQVVILHGRQSVTDGPTASAADLILLQPAAAGMPQWGEGDELVIRADGHPRFTGRITDRELTHTDINGNRFGVIHLQAAGRLADLGVIPIGVPPWPQQRSTARATNILTAAGVPFQVEGATGSAPLVLALDSDNRPALDLLGDLANDAGAAVCDTPAGVVVWQHYTSRAVTGLWEAWSDQSGTWQDQGPRTWRDTANQAGPGDVPPVPLPCDLIEWEPVWSSSLGRIINDVTIGYGLTPEGGEQPTYHADDADSIARHGRRHVGGQTQLADAAGATYRAGLILAAQAQPRPSMGSVIVHDPASIPGALELVCGMRVLIDTLPQPAPATSVVMVVEGWTHTYTPAGDYLTLNVSDPLHTYAGIVWSALSPYDLWRDVDPACTWADALTYPNLYPARTKEAAA